jgi:hypothetical protein
VDHYCQSWVADNEPFKTKAKAKAKEECEEQGAVIALPPTKVLGDIATFKFKCVELDIAVLNKCPAALGEKLTLAEDIKNNSVMVLQATGVIEAITHLANSLGCRLFE